jgi:hypothetical protein
MAMSQEEIAIVGDYNLAHDYAQNYMDGCLLQMSARATMIQTATQKFVAFLKLPEKTSSVGAIWDIAFASLSVLVPALGIGRELEESAKAIEIAAALGDKRAKALKLLVASAEIVKKLNEGKESINKIRETGEKLMDPPEGMKELEKLDASKKSIRDLQNSGYKALALKEAVLSMLNFEEQIRLSDAKTGNPESMLALAKKLVPKVPVLEDEDLDQIELMYLWLMISSYAKANVQIVSTTTSGPFGNYGTGKTISGLNDNQEETLIELFGLSAKRSQYFFMPPATDIYVLLSMWGVSTRKENNYVAPRFH